MQPCSATTRLAADQVTSLQEAIPTPMATLAATLTAAGEAVEGTVEAAEATVEVAVVARVGEAGAVAIGSEFRGPWLKRVGVPAYSYRSASIGSSLAAFHAG